MPLTLMLASHDVANIITVTITFLRSRQSKLDVTWFFVHVTQLPVPFELYDIIGVGVTLCHWGQCHMMPTASLMESLYSLGKDN